MIGVEITIAAATLTPVAHTVSKIWVTIIVSFDIWRFAVQDFDFEFLVIFIMAILLS